MQHGEQNSITPRGSNGTHLLSQCRCEASNHQLLGWLHILWPSYSTLGGRRHWEANQMRKTRRARSLDRQFSSLLVRQLHAPGAGAHGPPRPSVDARSPLISVLVPEIAGEGATNARRQLKRRQRRGTEKPRTKQARFRFPQGHTAPQAPHGPVEGLGWPSSQVSAAPQPPPLLPAPVAGAAGAATCPLSMCCMCGVATFHPLSSCT